LGEGLGTGLGFGEGLGTTVLGSGLGLGESLGEGLGEGLGEAFTSAAKIRTNETVSRARTRIFMLVGMIPETNNDQDHNAQYICTIYDVVESTRKVLKLVGPRLIGPGRT
jgi:hypothetical protein